MCAISGLFLRPSESIEQDLLDAMNNSMSSRGPDATGTFIQGSIGVAHRRLKVIDLSDQANQPMTSPDKKVILVYNGEIYNFRELKEDLRKRDHEFLTHSDTEVVLHAFLEWGPLAFKGFNGMFALAIADFRFDEPRLYLARDRFGIKPLFYTHKEGRLAFSSTLHGLFKVPWVEKHLNHSAIFNYLKFSHFPSHESVLEESQQLRPGHYALVTQGTWSEREFWSPLEIASDPSQLNHQGRLSKQNVAQWTHQFDEVLQASVKRQMVADVAVGTFLSGGIDSSLLTFAASKISPKIKTFCVGYEEQEFDETPYAQAVASALGTQHYQLIINAQDFLDRTQSLIECSAQPLADPTAISSLMLCEFARNHVTVVLAGDGGDELFYGYPHHATLSKLLRWLGNNRLGTSVFGLLDTPIRKIARGSKNPLIHQLYKFTEILQYKGEAELLQYFMGMIGPMRSDRLARLLIHKPDTTAHSFRNWIESISHLPIEDRVSQVFIRTFLPDTVLAKTDRTSMAHGLEVRVPFLDNEMAEFSSRLPFSLKYQNGMSKFLLRHTLRGKVPEKIIKRKKQGFSTPIRDWLRGPLRGLMEDCLNPNRLKQEEVFSPEEVASLVREHQEGRANHSHLLWTLVSFQLWKGHYLK